MPIWIMILLAVYHAIHHLLAGAGYQSHCRYVLNPHLRPGKSGHWGLWGTLKCRVYGMFGRMYPAVPSR